MNFRLALVTGATSGIGEALCKLLSQKGIGLILCGRDPQKLECLQQEVGAVAVVAAHLEDGEGRGRVVEAIRAHVPDLIINNAGFGTYGPALGVSMREHTTLFAVNGLAPLELTLEGARALIGAKKRGVVVNISSAGAFFAMPYMSLYGASKAFVTNLSKALDAELSPQGVRVLASCPGQVETEFAGRAAGKAVRKPKGLNMTAEFAAKEIWRQIEKGKGVQIIDWRYRLLIWVARHCLPEKLVTSVLLKSIKERTK